MMGDIKESEHNEESKQPEIQVSDNSKNDTKIYSNARNTFGKVISVVFIVIIALWIVTGIANCSSCSTKSNNTKTSSSSSSSSSSVDDITLITYAEFAVEDKLKSPSSAKFCAIDKFVVQRIGYSDDHIGYTTYGVKGYVDADNSYGANLRSEFVVKLDAKQGEDKYYVLSCTIE